MASNTPGYVHDNADAVHMLAQTAMGGQTPELDGDLDVEEALLNVWDKPPVDTDDEEDDPEYVKEFYDQHSRPKENHAWEALQQDPAEIWGLNQEQFRDSEGLGGEGVRHPEAVEPGEIAVESHDSILWRLVPLWMRQPLQRVLTPAVMQAASHAGWFTVFAVAFSYPNWFLIPSFNILSVLVTKSIELLPKYQAISRQGVAYYEPTMAYLQAHGATALDPQYIDLSEYAADREPFDRRRDDHPTVIDDNEYESDAVSNVQPYGDGYFPPDPQHPLFRTQT